MVYRNVGEKYYELKDHLGNVRVVVNDRKNLDTSDNTLSANVVSYNNYYPFGMPQPNRNFDSQEYRYGFQGQEKDSELKGVSLQKQGSLQGHLGNFLYALYLFFCQVHNFGKANVFKQPGFKTNPDQLLKALENDTG